MGEVYRATDTSLKRQVAIKVLPEALADDIDRLARFQRQAEVLEAAHEQGIIHRDLKPANIKLRPDGTVKVLDFGLAKAMAPAASISPAGTMSPTITTPAMTQAGLILGTAAYMSPEQAKGREADRRSDVWAFGCVLYEMLTGQRAFGGDEMSEVFASVLAREPALAAMPEQVPERIRKVVAACLRKDPRQRVHDIADARLALEGVFETAVRVESAPVAARAPLWVRAAPYVAMAALAVALAVVAWRPEPVPEVVRFQVHAPPGETLPLGVPAVSPDGRTLAYVVEAADRVRRLHVRDLDSVETRVLPGTEGALYSFWAPDGRSLAFVSVPDRVLRRVDIRAGSPRDLVSDIRGPWHGAWGPGGDLLHLAVDGVARASADGGTATATQLLVEGGGFPFFLPDGERFLLFNYDLGSIELATIGTEARTTVLENVESAPVLAPTPGGMTYVLYMLVPDLMAQEFDEASGTVRGEPIVVVSDIAQVALPAVRPAVGVSPGGVLAYQTGGSHLGGTAALGGPAGEPAGSAARGGPLRGSSSVSGRVVGRGHAVRCGREPGRLVDRSDASVHVACHVLGG